MNILIYSDLHVESDNFQPPKNQVADIVVLAGDIGEGFKGLCWAEKHFPDTPVVYVPGNLEFYYHDLDMIDELRARAPSNIYVLHNNVAQINGVRFLGSILWTDFELNGSQAKSKSMQAAQDRMSDFRAIKCDGWPFDPEASLLLHQQSRDWLTRALAIPYDGHTIVVTHHAPSRKSTHPRYQDDILNPAFASDLESLMDEKKVQYWIHGHTHDNFDYEVNGTRVLCNSRGYTSYSDSLNCEPAICRTPNCVSQGFNYDQTINLSDVYIN